MNEVIECVCVVRRNTKHSNRRTKEKNEVKEKVIQETKTDDIKNV